MSSTSGAAVSAPLIGPSSALNVLWSSGYPELYSPRTPIAANAISAGSIVSGQPTPEPSANHIGVRAGAFSDDYYHRIYLQPARADFGNLVTRSTRQVEIWNAFTQAVILDDVDGDIEGLAIGFTPPKRLRGLEFVRYPITATLDGPSFVDTQLTLHFSQGGQRTVVISYGRVLVFGFPPNWAKGFTERLEWLTDVLTMRAGNEQRIALRADPRRSFEFEVWEHGVDAGMLDLLLCSWQSRVYAVPVWTDKSRLAAPLAAGATMIAVETRNRDYHAGGLAIVGIGPRQTEALEIASMTADSIVLARPTIQSWAAGAWVAPARLARLPPQQSVTRPTAALSLSTLRFELDDLASDITPASDVFYRDSDIWLRRPNRIEDVTAEYQRLVDVFDNDTGTVLVSDFPNRPFIVRRFRYLLRNRADVTAMRAWLAKRAGRQVPFWAPTWERNIEVAAPIAPDALVVTIDAQGFATYFQGLPGRQDIAFLHRDGTWFFRHITGFEYAGGVFELIKIDEALGRACNPEDFVLVCFLELCRLENDAVELFFETDNVARVSLAIRSIDP